MIMKKFTIVVFGILGVLAIINKFIGRYEILEELDKWNKEGRIVEMMKSDSQVKEYLTFNEMINDSSIEAGDICKTLGYSEVNDGGIAYWKITKSNNPDKEYYNTI